MQLINSNGTYAADSREVSEMTGKRHDHLLRDIDGYVGILGRSAAPKIGVSDFFIESTYQDSTGRTLKRYLLTRKGCDMVANKMTGKKGVLFTATYVTKFEEMENRPQLPQTKIEALEAYLLEMKRNEALEIEISTKNEVLALQAPKVALYDTAMSAKNNLTMMAVAKALDIGRNKLFSLLRDKKVLMINNMPYQSYIDRGYFEVRQYTITHFTSGLENKTQTMVTPKGMAWIHTILTAKEA